MGEPRRRDRCRRVRGGIFQIVSAQANSAGVKLVREIEVSTVRTRAEALEQVLINLLINAVKASSQGSQVVLRVSRKDGGVEFAVTDFGIGMDQDQIMKIFDPLYTAWPVKTGMGLGLSLAKDIVDSMGGRIDVTSSPGKARHFRCGYRKVKDDHDAEDIGGRG